MRRFVILAPAAALALVAPLTPVLAQDASPEANSGAMIECTVEPRPTDELLPLFFGPGDEPVATPNSAFSSVTSEADLPQGQSADEETVTAIDATFQQWISCFITGSQYARGFALMTDQAASAFGPDVSNPDEDTAEEVRALLEGQLAGTPIPGDERMAGEMAVTGPRDARMLSDDRAAGIWSLDGDEVLVIFAQQDGRWLIDEFVDVPETGATPAATPNA